MMSVMLALVRQSRLVPDWLGRELKLSVTASAALIAGILALGALASDLLTGSPLPGVAVGDSPDGTVQLPDTDHDGFPDADEKPRAARPQLQTMLTLAGAGRAAPGRRRPGADRGRRGERGHRAPTRGIPAPVPTTPAATSPAPSAPATPAQPPTPDSPTAPADPSPQPVAARKVQLRVARIASVPSADGSGGELRVQIAIESPDDNPADQQQTPAAVSDQRVDLRVALSSEQLPALDAPAANTGAPVALRARMDVAPAADANAAPQLRVRLQLVTSDVQAPAASDTDGDADALSNTVDIVTPMLARAPHDDQPGAGDEDGVGGEPGAGEQPAPGPVSDGAATELRLALATGDADTEPARVSDQQTVALEMPAPASPTDPAAPVTVQVQVNAQADPAPAADTPTGTPPAADAPSATPDPAPAADTPTETTPAADAPSATTDPAPAADTRAAAPDA